MEFFWKYTSVYRNTREKVQENRRGHIGSRAKNSLYSRERLQSTSVSFIAQFV